MKRYVADLHLMENSSAGNPDRSFPAQTVFVQKGTDTSVTGIDGATSKAPFDTVIRWQGGTAADINGVTDVKIVEHGGETLVDGSLNLNFTAPTDIGGGMVEFAVFEGE